MRSATLVTLVGLGLTLSAGPGSGPQSRRPNRSAHRSKSGWPMAVPSDDPPQGPSKSPPSTASWRSRPTKSAGSVQVPLPDGAEAKINDLVTQLGDRELQAARAMTDPRVSASWPTGPQAGRQEQRRRDGQAGRQADGQAETRCPPRSSSSATTTSWRPPTSRPVGGSRRRRCSGTPLLRRGQAQVAGSGPSGRSRLARRRLSGRRRQYLDQAQTAWFDTDIELGGDTPIEVVAIGTISLYRGRTDRSEGARQLRHRHPTRPGTPGKGRRIRRSVLDRRKYTGTPKGQGNSPADGPVPVANQAQGTFKVTITPEPDSVNWTPPGHRKGHKRITARDRADADNRGPGDRMAPGCS